MGDCDRTDSPGCDPSGGYLYPLNNNSRGKDKAGEPHPLFDLLPAGGDEDHWTALGLVIDVAHQGISQVFLQVTVISPDRFTDQLAHPSHQLIRITDNDTAACNDFRI